MAAPRRSSVSAILLLCVAFAVLATLVAQADDVLLDRTLPDGRAAFTIRIPLSPAYEKLSPLKGAPVSYEVRKIRGPGGSEVPVADREIVETYLTSAGRGLGHPIGLVGLYFCLAYLLTYFMGHGAGARAALVRTQATTLGVLLAMVVAAHACLVRTGGS